MRGQYENRFHAIMRDPAVRGRTKMMLQMLEEADIVDALHEVRLLCMLIEIKHNEVIMRGQK